MFALAAGIAAALPQQPGSIRGVVHDADFDLPLSGVQVSIAGSGLRTTTVEQGNYVLTPVPPGRYTLVFSKEGYVQRVVSDVTVLAGELTEVDIELVGEFTEMEEYVVEDLLDFGAGTELALLQMRLDSAALMDSIGSELMSQAGASDAAAALRLVAGATVQDGKSAVIRGLPDRYVSSQMNSVRLPTADEDKRAVELDQFPVSVIESIQVAKTFTPDQQGDASGGAVDVRLRGMPEEDGLFRITGQLGYNSQVAGRDDFLSYDGGGLDTWGFDDGDRDIQYENLGSSWDGAVGVTPSDAPLDYKLGLAVGDRIELDSGVTLGGFASLFYERDSAYFDDGSDDSYWVDNPGDPMTPQTNQGAPDPSGLGDYKTSLFDVEQGRRSVQWGGLAGVGLESEHHSLALTYLYTHVAEDVATLAEDTRGKAYFDPNNYDPDSAPFLRMETLEYTERTTTTLQLAGRHELPLGGFDLGDSFAFQPPELDWVIAHSTAGLYQPDKRQFGSYWKQSAAYPSGFYQPYKPSANFNLGGLQRIWKEIDEQSLQYGLDLTFPFEQWSGEEGYVKAGVFDDSLERTFDQDTFSNFGDNSGWAAGWSTPWSSTFPSQSHPISESLYDVDYDGEQDISAWYSMFDLPVTSPLSVIAGVRFESTQISIVNEAESLAQWFPPGASAPVALPPGAADVDIEEDHALPSIGLVYEATDAITLRGSWGRTVARQTFKELTPIVQQEYLGGPIFIGNPSLGMSTLQNYDLRVDYAPYAGGLLSASWFAKDIDDPIEYVQRLAGFTFTTATNYPHGELSGYELELRQELGHFRDALAGLSLGANATFIESEVELPYDEQLAFSLPNIAAPMSSRDMTNAPEYLYNLYATYDWALTHTHFGLFYTVQGDTLVAGAGQSLGNFVPSVYAEDYGTLNLSVMQELGQHFELQLQAKNLTNPRIEEVYRSEYIPDDVTKTSYTKGIDYSISLGARFSF